MKYYILAALLIIYSNGYADEEIDMETISIIGNKELPNVLYIVPWKNPDLPEITEPSLSDLANRALDPLDRQTVLRQEEYYNSFMQYHEDNTNKQ